MADSTPFLEDQPRSQEDPPPVSALEYMGDFWRQLLIHPEVYETAERLSESGQKVTNFQFSGPALTKVWPAMATQWTFALFFPFLVAFVSACPEVWEPFAKYPSWVYLIFVPVIIFSEVFEVLALRYALCTVVQHCFPFRILGKTVGFNCWVCYIAFMSLVTHMDLATNGLFLAKIIKTVNCKGGEAEQISRIWAHTIDEAPLVSNFDFFRHLDYLVMAAWFLMFFQPLIGLAYAWPLGGQEVSYERESMKDGYRTIMSWNHPRGVLHHADALQFLGTVNRMVSINEKSLAWAIQRGRDILNQKNDAGRALDMLSREFDRLTMRLWFVSILEKMPMLEMQVTIFALSRCLMDRDLPWYYRVDGQMLVSLVFSGVTFSKVLYDAVDQMRLIWSAMRQEVPESLKNEEYRRAYSSLQWWFVLFLFGLILLALIMLHCFAKFLMAFVCEDSLWDISFSRRAGLDWKGCVDASRFLVPS